MAGLSRAMTEAIIETRQEDFWRQHRQHSLAISFQGPEGGQPGLLPSPGRPRAQLERTWVIADSSH